MAQKLLDVQDLTLVPDVDRVHVIDVEICPHVRATLQAAADKRGMTLEEYARGLMMTAAVVSDLGGGSTGGSA